MSASPSSFSTFESLTEKIQARIQSPSFVSLLCDPLERAQFELIDRLIALELQIQKERSDRSKNNIPFAWEQS